jgi:von Willebrand factor type A domain
MAEPDERSRQLDELAERVDRMATAPEEVKVGWMALARPFLKLVGWQPNYETDRLRDLVNAVIARDELDDAALRQRLEAAIEELDLDIRRAERVTVVHGRVPTAHLAWLARMLRVTSRIDAALATSSSNRALAAIDEVLVAPPLAVAVESIKPSPDADEPSEEQDPTQARLVELQLAAIDHIIEAAREETSFLSRRRSLLEAARRLLLDADASLPLDDQGVKLRKRYLAEQIVQVDRVQAAGLSPRVSLQHQARSALARGERERLFAALAALESFALTAGDELMGRKVGAALRDLAGDTDTTSNAARDASMRRSTQQAFGQDVTRAIAGVYGEDPEARKARVEHALAEYDQKAVDLALAYLDRDNEADALSALMSVDGCFDVGAPLVPVRVREESVTARLVRHPTRDLILTRAQGPEDLSSAIITDPRALLLDLATGRLLSRRFVQYDKRTRERTEMVGEARIYLLDGSSSMLEQGQDMARARMRDAILVAELATMMDRLRHADANTRVMLFYRYFTKRIGPVTRVTRPDEALAAIGEVMKTPRRGGTDIEGALAASFETIRQARGRDAALAQAQIVLITDGKATVRDEVLQRARQPVDDMAIAVSVIALGEENAALRRLVARQRAQGERAFYHFLDDGTLAELCLGRASLSRALHLPELPPATPEELARELGGVLDDLTQLERLRHGAVLRASESGDELLQALGELGLDERALSDGQRTRRAASARDRRAVQERFDAWFPLEPDAPLSATISNDDVDSTVVVLGTVAEVVGEMPADPLMKQADSVDILERLLPDARLSPDDYEAVVRSRLPQVSEAIAGVRAAAGDKPAG